MRSARNLFAVICWAGLISVGLSGCKGDPGAAGPAGLSTTPSTTGTISGLVTITGGTAPAEGVKVVANPGNVRTATNGDGKYALDVPAGVYTLTFGAGVNDDGFDPVTVSNVPVVAGASSTINASVARLNPLTVTPTTVAPQVGFGKPVTLCVTVGGVPSGATPSFAWTQISGPRVSLSGANTAAPRFVTLKIGDVINASRSDRSAAIGFLVPARKGPVGISTQHETELSYGFKVTITAGGFVKSATTVITSAAVTSGANVIPVGVNVVLSSPAQSRYAWAITLAPSGSSAALDYPSDQFATFVPDREGTYTITESGWTGTFVVASYKGPSTCLVCHNAGFIIGPEQVAKWQRSGHKNLFQRGISGLASDHYSAACLSCHTTGDFKGGTIKGSFGDVASQLGWRFPATLTPTNWTTLPEQLKDLGSISCESCHGPGSQHAANPNRVSLSMSNNACNQCHEAVGHHDRGFLESKGAHSNLTLAMEEATVEGRGETAAHCGRCHSAQGFKEYLKQLEDGNNGPIVKPASYTGTTLEWLADLGLTDAKVDNPGCPTCHEPHSAELRIEGPTPVLPSGFAVADAGKGAVCMTCHNTRNGLHDNQHAPTNTSAPHTPSQTDVLMGKNAYFVDTAYAFSRHAAARDTCATCHMATPVHDLPFLPADYHMGGTNHSFHVNESICASCHSAGVTGEAIMAEVNQGLTNINQAAGRVLVEACLRPLVNPGFIVTAYDQASDRYSNPVTITALPADSRSVSFALEIHGQQSACLTLPAPISVTWTGDPSPTNITNLCFQLNSLKRLDSTPIVPVNSKLVKGLWNYYLVKGDGSHGIHNPTFVYQILTNTEAELVNAGCDAG